uniref:Protein kinase domain-containing protein n=1 Tax=Fagus sylvatica TaxID=28930 RepID=A0A2N9GUT5_FAGSY
MLVISGIAIYRNRVWAYKSLSNNGNVGLSVDVSLRSFTYLDLEKITDGFKEELGRGSFGTVYKGTIWNGQKLVAIKRLEKVSAEGEKEFQTEMKVIGRTHHKNLVRLLDVLFTPEKQPCWDERIEIARNIAKGILYLHEESRPNQYHDWHSRDKGNLSEEESILEEWAYHCFEARELGKLASGTDVDKRQLERMVKVGLWCILDEPSLRPSMKKVC